MLISVITTSVRPDGLPIIEKCLRRQTFRDFEWIVVMPKEKHNLMTVEPDVLLSDPPKNDGDFWTLCKAWNLAYSKAGGKLIVNIQDWLWFPPDTLERFWNHYVENEKSLVTACGNHYDQIDERGVPTNMVWVDPRIGEDAFKKVGPEQMEMCMCSVPKQAVLDCGGVDEEYDKGPGIQEKEMCLRLRILGYEMYQDQQIEYRALHHPRLTSDWDDMYFKVTAPMFEKHVKELSMAIRPLNVGYVK